MLAALRAIDGFEGGIDALPEGTLAFAGPGVCTDGSPLTVAGSPLCLYTPLLQVRTDMVRAKLIETPWLGFINHMSMIASKAARVAGAARGKPLYEFGARRTHPAAAVDASYAAYVGGCDATSNLAAYARYGIPAVGTMDHFAVQASEREGVALDTTEGEFYAVFAAAFPTAATLLVDTYDTERGIREAVRATGGRLTGVRIDSNVTPDSIAAARALLDGLGAKHVKIFVSDGLDERRVAALADVADGFGVGENISCSPDAATGVGAVAKLIVNGYGKPTMKLARGRGKATSPVRSSMALRGSRSPRARARAGAFGRDAAPKAGVARARAVHDLPAVQATRDYARAQIAALPARLRRSTSLIRPHPGRLRRARRSARRQMKLSEEDFILPGAEVGH